MASALDVAAYILQKHGRMTTMKLQKLVYYAQAWALVWDEKPLFSERIEAWANGPVCPDLYCAHRGFYAVDTHEIEGKPGNLTSRESETVDAVLKYYGDKPAQWLIELTHIEAPWIDARGSTPPGAASNVEISLASMADYYSSLPKE
ncbi:Panacea domain-containing protein [Acidithiobacillus sp.]